MGRPALIKQVLAWDEPFQQDGPSLLATFRLDEDGRVHADFESPGFESEVRAGLPTPVGWAKERVFLEDGRLFFDALDVVFRTSALTSVRIGP